MPSLEPLVPLALSLWRETGVCHWIVSSGESMQPLIRNGDQLLVCHDLTHLRQGSIVVFERDGGLIAHRVLKIMPGEPRCLLTQGDNTRNPDPLVAENRVIGQVLALQRGARQVDLDSRLWRATGWTLASSKLALLAAEDHLQPLKDIRRPVPRAVARAIRQGTNRFLKSLILIPLHLGRTPDEP